MAGPSFSSMHSCTVGSVSNRRAWPSMSWGRKTVIMVLFVDSWRQRCSEKQERKSALKTEDNFVLCPILTLQCSSSLFSGIHDASLEVIYCDLTGSHPSYKESLADHLLKKLCRGLQRSDKLHSVAEEMKQEQGCSAEQKNLSQLHSTKQDLFFLSFVQHRFMSALSHAKSPKPPRICPVQHNLLNNQEEWTWISNSNVTESHSEGFSGGHVLPSGALMHQTL